MDKQENLELRVKHLGFIQNIIARMGNNSATLKNYCMALVMGIIGISVTIKNSDILLFAIPIIFIFSILDSYYLRLERAFRKQYDHVRLLDINVAPDFQIIPNENMRPNWINIYFSWSIAVFYISIMAILVAINLYLEKFY